MLRKLSGIILFTAAWNLVQAQAPGGVPYGEPEPLELTPFNIVLYIVVPVLLFVALILIRNRRKKRRK